MKNFEYLKREFWLCNNYSYLDKPVFWKIKAKVLKSYGIFDGYDYREIAEDCPVCSDSKEAQNNCFNCNGSRFKIVRKYFLRYKLFKQVYHLPSKYDVRQPELLVSKIGKKEIKKYENRLELYLALIKLALVFAPELLSEIINTVTGKECVKKFKTEIRHFYKNQKTAA